MMETIETENKVMKISMSEDGIEEDRLKKEEK